MAAPSHAGSAQTATAANATPKTIAAGTRSAGDLVVVAVLQTGTSPNTFAVTDSAGNTYTQIQRQVQVGRIVELWYCVLVTGGSITVTVAATDGTPWAAVACWATPSPGAVIALDTSGKAGNATGTTHYCAPSGAIDTDADVYVVVAATTTNSAGTVTDPSGFTRREAVSTDRSFLWTRESVGTLTDERGQWGSANSIQSAGAVASFKTVAFAPSLTLIADWW